MRRAVLFDLYGTLVDIKTNEEDAALWRRLADWLHANLGRDVWPDQLHWDYARLVDEEVRIHGEGFALSKAIHELLGKEVSEEQVRRFANELRKLSTQSLALREYAIPLLARLRTEQFRLALVSNTEAIFTNYDIDCVGLRGFFDAIVLSSEVGVAKPDPGILEEALRSILVTAREAVFVGDTVETDALAARRLDMPCVLIRRNSEKPMPYIDDSITFAPPVLQDIYTELIRLLNT
jgi:putative hydrolase of the HAD superfamily